MTLPTFAEQELEILWTRLEQWQSHSDSGMSKTRYLEMQEQLGKEPDPEKCPPGIEDFPEVVINAIEIFNSLGDRVYPEVGYTGKDYTNLEFLLKVYNIEDKELIYSILLRLDSHAIKKSQEQIKREYDKVKRKNGK